LEEGRFRRVGSTRDRTADVRVIAATNRNLADDVSAGRFRADLFYRLNVISLHVPPLRQRREDIPVLVEHFLAIYRERFSRPALDLSMEARRRLDEYDWPGNVRELRNTLERSVALSAADLIEAEQVLPTHAAHAGVSESGTTDTPAAPSTLEELERRHILHVLEETDGNRERAAALLGISSRTLYRKLREYETGAEH
ncbi:MAG: sigma 54-interacting transcriptional regulator, partial [Acidobacteria bacterium]|nr:sigma 54-interacting transcriptional regulator [Acidobacteriota bacterium]